MTTKHATLKGDVKHRMAIRILWNFGLAVIIAHIVIMAIGAVAVVPENTLSRPGWSSVSRITRTAFWLVRDSRYHLVLAVILNCPVVVIYIRYSTNRPYRLLTMLLLIAWSAWLVVIAASMAWLVTTGPIVLQHVGGATRYPFYFSEIWSQILLHLYLAVPLLIHCARLLPLLWPPNRRRLSRIKGGLCEQCGYDLRGIMSKSCPECGAATLGRGGTAAGQAPPLN